MPCYPFFGEGSPTKIDYRKMGTLILTSLLEDPVRKGQSQPEIAAEIRLLNSLSMVLGRPFEYRFLIMTYVSF